MSKQKKCDRCGIELDESQDCLTSLLDVGCLDTDRSGSNSTISLKETKAKSKYSGKNDSRKYLCVFKVDGCLIQNQQIKCDYLIIDCTEKIAYLIELKGTDVSHALDQLYAAIEALKSKLGEFYIKTRIVATKIPTANLITSKTAKLEKKLKTLNKQFKPNDDHKVAGNNQMNENI